LSKSIILESVAYVSYDTFISLGYNLPFMRADQGRRCGKQMIIASVSAGCCTPDVITTNQYM